MKKNKKILLLLALLLLAGTGVYLYLHKHSQVAVQIQSKPSAQGASSDNINYGPPSASEKQAQEQQKQDIIKQDLANQTQNSSTTSTPATSTQNKPAQNISVSIARAKQLSSGQPLSIRANITGTSDGECDITLSQSGQTTINKSFPIGLEATVSSCQGSDIAASDFSASGDWNLQVIAKSGSNQSQPVSQIVMVAK